MIKNFFKTAVRNLLRHKVFSFINIAGLAAGLSICIVVVQLIISNTGFNSYIPDAENKYRLSLEIGLLGQDDPQSTAVSPILWAPALQKELSGIASAVRLYNVSDGMVLQSGSVEIHQDDVYMADPEVFTFFGLQAIDGDPVSALQKPLTAVLTESSAIKYFGTVKASGKQLIYIDRVFNSDEGYVDNQYELSVGAVIKDLPGKSTLRPAVLISLITLDDWFGGKISEGSHEQGWYWRGRISHTFLELTPGTGKRQMEELLGGFYDKYAGEMTRTRGYEYAPYLQPVETIHNEEGATFSMSMGIAMSKLYLYSLIAVIVLVIAILNFMNLSTARSILRAREVGIRKVSGSPRRLLIMQFLGESLFFSFIALLLALLMAEFVTGLISEWLPVIVGGPFDDNAIPLLMAAALLACITGMLAGIYPAIVLSAFKPVHVLRRRLSGIGGVNFRRGMVVAQFALTILFIFGTLSVRQQVASMKNKDLGFANEQLVIIPYDAARELYRSRQGLVPELEQIAGVNNVAFSTSIPGDPLGGDLWGKKGDTPEDAKLFMEFAVDYNFFDVYHIETVSGRLFDPAYGGDSWRESNDNAFTADSVRKVRVVINEAGVKALGFASPEDAIGKVIVRDVASRDCISPIIGVVKDFHFESVKYEIQPAAFFIWDDFASHLRYASIEVTTAGLPATLDALRSFWAEHIPDTDFDFTFSDEAFAELYQEEETMFELFSSVSLFSIFIACLGLFGLVSFLVEQKEKEIGVRKVLGASVQDILLLISTEYFKLIVVAGVIALPVGAYLTSEWLQEFAHRVYPGVDIYLVTVLSTMLIAGVTVSSLALRAAYRNPAQAIRQD